MNFPYISYAFVLLSAGALGQTVTVDSTAPVWHPREITVHTGVPTSEAATAPNPWLFYRLTMTLLSPSEELTVVHGFYAGDGAGGADGDVWKVRFAPSEPGLWRGIVGFSQGPNLNVEPLTTPGEAVPGLSAHGLGVTIVVSPLDPDAPGFLRWGPLEYVGEPYLKFRDGSYFIKGGINSPENLLAYVGFDGLVDQGWIPCQNNFLHRFEVHREHWLPGDPDWTTTNPMAGFPDEAGRGMIGALNWLASRFVNAVYFMPNNLGGDGRDAYPFLDPSGQDNVHYDVSRMEQWNEVFEHATRRGIMLQFVLSETEEDNSEWLDGGFLGPQRKLYYKNLVAMFGHNLAVKWNLAEENNTNDGVPNGLTFNGYPVERLNSFAAWIADCDPYDHPITVHSLRDESHFLYPEILESAGGDWLNVTSAQATVPPTPIVQSSAVSPDNISDQVEFLRDLFGGTGVIDVDEPWSITGMKAVSLEDHRKAVLYDVYFSGANLDWHFGADSCSSPTDGGDHATEDFTTRETLFLETLYARRLIAGYPFWMMEPLKSLVFDETEHDLYGDAVVFGLHDNHYLVYYPDATDRGRLDLTGVPNLAWVAHWFDPRTGMRVSAPMGFRSDRNVVWLHAVLAPPPYLPGEDWVLEINRADG